LETQKGVEEMKQSTLETPSGSLPVTRDLTQAYNLSLIVALLITAASLGGLLFSSSLYPTDELRQSFLTNDLVNLLIGLPVLLGSMWLARRGKLVGLLCWPGAHLYIFYNYLAYLVGVPFSLMTLVFAALLMVSGYLMFDLVRKIDREALKTKLAGAVVEKLSGGILILFGAAFFGLAVGVLSTPSTGNQRRRCRRSALQLPISPSQCSCFLAAFCCSGKGRSGMPAVWDCFLQPARCSSA
jgi:hypothetical protein